jgi:hypothetical protein
MKLGPPSRGGPSEEDNRVVQLRPAITSSVRPANPHSIVPAAASQPEDDSNLWQTFVDLRDRAWMSGDIADGRKAGKAFARYLLKIADADQRCRS